MRRQIALFVIAILVLAGLVYVGVRFGGRIFGEEKAPPAFVGALFSGACIILAAIIAWLAADRAIQNTREQARQAEIRAERFRAEQLRRKHSAIRLLIKECDALIARFEGAADAPDGYVTRLEALRSAGEIRTFASGLPTELGYMSNHLYQKLITIAGTNATLLAQLANTRGRAQQVLRAQIPERNSMTKGAIDELETIRGAARVWLAANPQL